MADLVRIGLIGAGRMGRNHLSALERASGVTIVGVVEPAREQRAAVVAAGHPAYERAGDLLERDGVDAVLVAAPSDLHRPLVQAITEHGLPVLCEKPVGVHQADAEAAAATAAEHGMLLQVGYWRRFVPELRRLRRRIADGELGEISHVSCFQWDREPPARAFRSRSGGIAIDMAVHEFDQARWLTGQELAWVTAIPSGDVPSRDPDAATILAALSGGTSLMVSVGRHFPHGDCCWLEVFGTRGYERVAFMWGADGDTVFETALTAQIEAFAARVRGDADPDLGAADGADAVVALVAAELSGDALLDGRRRDVPAPAALAASAATPTASADPVAPAAPAAGSS